jgi:hypothetical protein
MGKYSISILNGNRQPERPPTWSRTTLCRFGILHDASHWDDRNGRICNRQRYAAREYVPWNSQQPPEEQCAKNLLKRRSRMGVLRVQSSHRIWRRTTQGNDSRKRILESVLRGFRKVLLQKQARRKPKSRDTLRQRGRSVEIMAGESIYGSAALPHSRRN